MRMFWRYVAAAAFGAVAVVIVYRRAPSENVQPQQSSKISQDPTDYGSFTHVNTPVDIQGTPKQKLVKFGRWLQHKDYEVTEQKEFGGVTPGEHEKGSPHFSDNAIDVNKDSPDEAEALDSIVKFARRYGLRTVWRHLEETDHAHFDTRGGPDLNEDTKD